MSKTTPLEDDDPLGAREGDSRHAETARV